MPLLKLIAIGVTVLAMLAIGCARQVHNIGAPVQTSKPNASSDEIAKAIIRAGVNTNWRVTESGPGTLVAVRVQGAHSATINITYTQQNYTISLKESTMERDGVVHREYNRWVQQLDIQIRSQLAAI